MGFMAPAITPAPALLVAVGYRLAPGAKYPEPVDDCRAALRWIYDNIAGYGGDPERIYVGGHSAGGHLAAMLTLQRDRLTALGMPSDVIKGCFPVSGVFDVTETPPDRREAFLRSDDDARDASPVYNTGGNATPFLLEIGSDDFENLRTQPRGCWKPFGHSRAMWRRWCATAITTSSSAWTTPIPIAHGCVVSGSG